MLAEQSGQGWLLQAPAANKLQGYVAGLGGLSVTGVAAGLAHTVACTDSGDVYSWGWNSEGQLGLGDDQSRGEPALVADPQLEHLHVTQVMG